MTPRVVSTGEDSNSPALITLIAPAIRICRHRWSLVYCVQLDAQRHSTLRGVWTDASEGQRMQWPQK